nr:hypothetical protein [Tanacetum cinerariifolium]
MTLADSADKPSNTFDELMNTPIDFSAYIMNGLKITSFTQETLLGPTFRLLKGTLQHERMILESVENGPLLWPSIEENEVTRSKKYSELSATEVIQADCDVKATNIILQGLPPEKGESLREFYLRFSLLLNDINIYNMKLEQFQVKIMFLNTLPPEWSKFMTNVKLVRDLHTTNVDQLHAYLGQHEFHANERTVVCYKCKGEGHVSKQCTKPKRKRDESWFKDKAMPLSEQSNIVNQSETEITSYSNIIPYSQYKTNAIVIRDSKKTLMLAEESHYKMLLKQKDLMMSEKKVNTKPVDYATLNQLSQDFKTRFVPQTELSAEQVFWSRNFMNSEEPNLSTRPTQVEVPKELPKVSMVNTSLKKLKHHLARFDVVVKERTTATAITECT